MSALERIMDLFEAHRIRFDVIETRLEALEGKPK